MSDQPMLIRPYLSLAVFCEKVLKESDGVISAIRIVDRWAIPGTTEHMPKATIAFSVLIVFKSGEYRGRAEIELKPIPPSQRAMPSIKFPVNFEGDDDRGIGLATPIQFQVEEEGLYWFDVSLGIGGGVRPELITRIPMRILYQRVQTVGGA